MDTKKIVGAVAVGVVLGTAGTAAVAASDASKKQTEAASLIKSMGTLIALTSSPECSDSHG